MSELLTVDGLTVRYDDTVAVTEADFKIKCGEFVGLVGESGAGKSTLGGSLVGLSGECSGSIRFDGIELVGTDDATLRAIRGSRIGLAFQDASDSLHPAYTVGRQIAESIDGSGRRWQIRHGTQVESLLDDVGLEPRLMNRYPHELSGGQKQRTLLAVALAGEPDLLIADEPTSSLDTLTQARVLETLKMLGRERDLTVLLITHDLAVVGETCDRALVMNDGAIVDRGRTDEVLTDPTHPYTKALVEAHAMGSDPDNGGHSQRHGSDADDTSAGISLSTPTATTIRHTQPTTADMQDSDTPLVELNGVSKRYREESTLERLVGKTRVTTALEDVSMTINTGESVALVGRSGAGKTTVARLIAGLETPTSGTVQLRGRAVAHVRNRSKRARESVGYVFQSPGGSLHPRRRVAASIGEPLRAAGFDRESRRSRIESLLTAVDLSGYGDRYPRELSGGEAQRAAIARAIACEPVLLILDEATSALDTVTAARICDLVDDLRRERNLALVTVTHDFRIARRLADKTLVLRDGQLVDSGETTRLLEDSSSEHTRELVNAAPTV